VVRAGVFLKDNQNSYLGGVVRVVRAKSHILRARVGITVKRRGVPYFILRLTLLEKGRTGWTRK